MATAPFQHTCQMAMRGVPSSDSHVGDEPCDGERKRANDRGHLHFTQLATVRREEIEDRK
jgi:hypothetical protein